MKTSNKSFAIIGNCAWAKIQKPDDNGKFSIDVYLDDAGIKLLKSLGLEPRDKGDGKKFFTPWKHAFDLEGNPKTLKVIDKDGNPFTDLVGNESRVAVEFIPKEWKYMNKSGVKAMLLKVQVLDHIKWVPIEKTPEERALGKPGTIKVEPTIHTNRIDTAGKTKTIAKDGMAREVV